jgi:hypothetical protein
MRNAKTRWCMLFLFALCVIPTGALATLMQFTSEDGMLLVRDDITHDVWIADMDRFSGMTPDDVVAEIGDLKANSYGGFNTWVLASKWEVRQLFKSVTSATDANLFGQTYAGNYGSGDEWGSWGLTSTRVNPDDPNDNSYYAPWLAQSDDWPLDKGLGGGKWSYPQNDPNDIGAWVKTTEYPVPEPMTILLLGTGMVALASFKRRFWRT